MKQHLVGAACRTSVDVRHPVMPERKDMGRCVLPFHCLLTVIKVPARVFMGLQARLGHTDPVLSSAWYQLPWG